MDWKTAVLDLISARSELILLELAEFRRQSARRAALLVLAVLAAASGWLLLLAGSVPLLAQVSGISWPIMALVLAALHIALVGVFLSLARRNPGPAFTATITEFQKDREWIENITKTPKS
jgi:uncharacterized membrane protein YqjE